MHVSGAAAIYGALSRSRGVILTFHHVRDTPVPDFAPNAHLTVTPAFLDDLLDGLRRRSVDLVSMDEVPERLARERPGRRFAAITFDDGYRDNLEVAAPILRAHRAPFAIYVTTGFVTGEAHAWWTALETLVRRRDSLLVQAPEGDVLELDCSGPGEKCAAYHALIRFYRTRVPEAEVDRHVRELCWLYDVDEAKALRAQVMSEPEIAALAEDPLCTLGAHTVGHRLLARLSPDEAKREIALGRDALERMSGREVRHLAYPYGFRGAAKGREFAIARELGFATAVTTRRGALYREHADHLLALPRISMNGHYQRRRYATTLISGLPTKMVRRGRRLHVL